MNEVILTLEGVSLSYHTTAGETQALTDINLSLNKGDFVAIVGPSGAGKTTILSLVAGLIMPTGGKITVGGMPVSCPSGEVGYMLQKDTLLEWLTIERNVELGLKIQRKLNAESKAYAHSLLEKYGLRDFAKYFPSQLSGGMRQRAALIRTLAFKPKILLLDEPFSALDYQTRLSVAQDVGKIIAEEGVTALLVSHDISEAISLASRVAILSARPAVIKKIVDIDICGDAMQKRESPRFRDYFELIWKELQQEG